MKLQDLKFLSDQERVAALCEKYDFMIKDMSIEDIKELIKLNKESTLLSNRLLKSHLRVIK